jgi:hypothetical protein
MLKFPDMLPKPLSTYTVYYLGTASTKLFPLVYYEDSDVQSDVVNISFVICIIYAVPRHIICL